ncbi:MAG: hypothetical protein IRY89_08505 [Pseudolabrys sp.]|nr:hypothetical protein [Pseudolabrys sp.]
MRRSLVPMVAAAVTVLMPLGVQAQKKASPADAERVVKLISADKAKIKTYCDMVKLGDAVQEAEQKKDNKKMEEIGKRMDEMSQQLGPEYVALMESMENLSEKEAEAIGTVLERLDKLCAD